MSRIIKFRVWDKHDNKWRDLLSDAVYSTYEQLERPERFVVNQFTGFIDKSGREIYEGDLVNFTIPGITHGPEREELTNMEVHWDQEEGCWAFGRCKNGWGEVFSYSVGDRIDTETFEVVGNIMEKAAL